MGRTGGRGSPARPVSSTARFTGIQSSASASAASTRAPTRRISGPGRNSYGLDGNHCVKTSRHISWRARGNGPLARNTAQVPVGTSRTSRPSGTSASGPAATAW